MFLGHADDRTEFRSAHDMLIPDHVLEGDEDKDKEADDSSQILYMASFDELARNCIQYESIIWLSISLLLVLAWGVGVIMLLYLPFKRYMLQKDISSRKLYVTPTEIVYKVSRPSFIPCWKTVTTVTRVPLSLVIDIIIEQGCLQSVFGIQTLRVESISYGKAAPVDELQLQGVSNPGHLRKVIVAEASKAIRDAGMTMSHTSSLNDRLASLRLSSKKWKKLQAGHSPHPVSTERRGIASGELLLHKLDKVDKSVKRIESLIDRSQIQQKPAERFEDVEPSL